MASTVPIMTRNIDASNQLSHAQGCLIFFYWTLTKLTRLLVVIVSTTVGPQAEQEDRKRKLAAAAPPAEFAPASAVGGGVVEVGKDGAFDVGSAAPVVSDDRKAASDGFGRGSGGRGRK